ncbi:MAG: hypothetical protein K2L96_08335 [Muribaculaceae bacterium]|nr:hypothetical protein [Muribaculaceae bacterium]
MKKAIISFLIAILCALILHSCADHDDPQLAPIDTSQIKISATVKDFPNASWLAESEQITISVSNIEMTAPKGVVLRSISLIAQSASGKYLIDDKPYSGEPLEFKIPLNGMKGRINFSLRGNLIKQNSRDAEVIIKDNIQTIVFSENPKFECEAWLYFSVKSKSTSGEEYSKTFEVKSTDHFTIHVPGSELYWEPASGTASTLELTIGSGATAWSPNTSFDCTIPFTAIGHSSGDPSTLKLTIPNTPGSLKDQQLQLYVQTVYYGTWENVTIDEFKLLNVFSIVEKGYRTSTQAPELRN